MDFEREEAAERDSPPSVPPTEAALKKKNAGVRFALGKRFLPSRFLVSYVFH